MTGSHLKTHNKTMTQLRKEFPKTKIKGRTSWSKGLTKETDFRLKNISKQRSKLIKSGKLPFMYYKRNQIKDKSLKCLRCGREVKNLSKNTKKILCEECRNKKTSYKYKNSKKDDYVICQICKQKFGRITSSHLKKHNFTIKEYKNKYNSSIISKKLSKNQSEKMKKDWIKNKRQLNHKYRITTPHRLLKEGMVRENIFDGFKDEQYIFNYSIDIANEEKKILIFVDGSYYHGDPRFFKLNDIICHGDCTVKQKRKYDKSITKNLQKNGYKVLRFWEYDIHNNLEECISKIKDII